MATQFVADIVNVGEVQMVANNRGGSYGKLDVLYKNSRTGKVESKNLVDFNNKDIFNTMKLAKKGDVFTISLDKNAKGYWEWTSVSSGAVGGTPEISSGGSVEGPRETVTSTRPYSSSVPAKTYETADERAKRQKLIIAQSSISNAIASLQTGKTVLDPQVVLNLADFYYSWVTKKGVDFSDMVDDIPQ